MDPRIEHALRDIALHTDRSFQTVERVCRILMKAIQYDTVLMMIDGRLKAVREGKPRLPSSLLDEIDASYDDVAALAERIFLAGGYALMDEDDDEPETLRRLVELGLKVKAGKS